MSTHGNEDPALKQANIASIPLRGKNELVGIFSVNFMDPVAKRKLFVDIASMFPNIKE